jgi:energy-coupling factor transporter ATP-binding protein EcfA2
MDENVTLSLQEVTFTYEGEVVALQNINLTARRGEFVVVLGANGAGKSTLCYLLSGITPHIYGGHRRGIVSVAGIDPWDVPLYETSQVCGALMQDPEVQLFMPTIRTELAFGPANLGVSREEILRRSEVALSLVRMNGYEERNPRDLSGGQKQRIALASVLTMQPRVLVLDEPTSQLDPAGRWEVGEAIERLKRSGDLTIVMTTHETEEILHLADQVLVLERGRTALQGTPAEVFSQTARLEQAGVKTPALILFQSRLFGDKTTGKNQDESKITLTVDEVAQRVNSAVQVGDIKMQATILASPISPPTGRIGGTGNNEQSILLDARRISVQYPGPPVVTALKDVSLQISQGEIVGIVGQNGSGKSTLVKCFVGLLRPSSGDICFKGDNIRKIPVGEMSRRVGLVLQNPDYQLFTASCLDEIRFGLRNVGVPEEQIQPRAEQALHRVGLSGMADLFPFRLSFGDRRKLAVAATLALEPEVLILDEPTTAQDHRGRYQLADLAKRFHDEQGGTVLMITHDVDLIAHYANRLIVLYNGQVLLDGPTAEVFTHVEELRRSFVVPPVATQLAMKLASLGIPPDIITLDQLYALLGS